MPNLVLSRHDGESFHIGKDITIKILRAEFHKARILIQAPPDILILRDELLSRSPPKEPKA
jgi:carbon storage regulator CsrA